MTSDQSVPITFAGVNSIVQPHSLKLSVEITNWHFVSIRNKLEIAMAVDVDPQVCFLLIIFLYNFIYCIFPQLDDECSSYDSSVDSSGMSNISN